ncbi:helix-turn-helix domain-containing protein [Candidatus Acidulodesulfobacterium sp. H_13]|uniref:helix-turn-helix domain-containing protein n=1 Tax=Candidatus Acidulodesulfobacterium sp. H_13 TaxID=3395470 RepID=UPI003AF7BE48
MGYISKNTIGIYIKSEKEMKFKGHKYRLYSNTEQAHELNKQFGCSRFAWNYFLDLRRSIRH